MKRAAGFTLLEVVVALAISGLALAALMSATGTGLTNAKLADQYVEATGRIQSRIAQLGVTIPLEAGEYSGDEGNGYRWRLRVTPKAALPAKEGDQPHTLFAIEVTMSWESAGRTSAATFHTERIGIGAPSHD